MSDALRYAKKVSRRNSPPAMFGRRTFLRRSAIVSTATLATPWVVTHAYAASSLRVVRFCETGHLLSNLNLYVARERGYFLEQGLDLGLRVANDDGAVIKLVREKTVEFGCGDPTLPQHSSQAQRAIVVLGSITARARLFGISKRLAKPIMDPHEFKGMTFATRSPPSIDYDLLLLTLQDAGLTTEDVKITPVPIGRTIDLALTGEVDIALTVEPYVEEAIRRDAHIVFSWPKFIGPFCGTCIYALPEFLGENRDVAQRVANALQKGALAAYGFPAHAQAVARKIFSNLDSSIVNAAVERQLNTGIIAATFPVDREGWESLMKARSEDRSCRCDLPFGATVDNSFANNAVAHVQLFFGDQYSPMP